MAVIPATPASEAQVNRGRAQATTSGPGQLGVQILASDSENHGGTPSPLRPGSSSDRAVNRAPIRVMVVEDESVIALDLEMRLTRLGYDVVAVCDNCEDAIALFVETHPQLVLMDICISGPVDGIETASAISRLSDVPVVFLTAYADQDTVRRASKTSPYGYLLKPFDERSVSVTLTIALQRHAADVRARLFSTAIESATVGIALVDIRGPAPVIEFVNKAYLMSVERTPEQLIGLPLIFSSDPQDRETIARLQAAVEHHQYADGVVQGKRSDGTTSWTTVTLCPVPSPTGKVTHMVSFHKDITALREAESTLASTQRFETIGLMTASIAHDFNNVLNIIMGFAEFARDGDDSTRPADLDEIVQAARRGEKLTRKLLDFSRRPDPSPESGTDLARVMADLLTMVQRLVGPYVDVEMRVGAGSMIVSTDSTSIEQVLLNLVANARDAMPAGGRVGIDVTCPATPSGALAAGRYVRIAVRDTGTGIDPLIVKRMFEPLFTTKPRGQGTGLGLSTSRMLIEREGGTITIESVLNEGTTVHVDLPLTDRAAALAALVSSSRPPPR